MPYDIPFLPIKQHQKDPEAASNDADDILDTRMTDLVDYDFTSAGVELSDDQMKVAVVHRVTNCDTSGRILLIPDASAGDTSGPIMVASDPANTEGFTLRKGTTDYAVGPGEIRSFWNFSDANTLIESAAGGSYIMPVSRVPEFSGARVTQSTGQALTQNRWVTLAFDQEDYDTDGYHDNAVNNSRLTIPAGVDRAQLCFTLLTDGTETTSANVEFLIGISKNGGGPRSVGVDTGFRLVILDDKCGLVIFTEELEVEEGDYFEAHAFFYWSGIDETSEASAATSFSVLATRVAGTSGSAGRDIEIDYYAGTPSANETIYQEALTESIIVDDAFAGSAGYVDTNPSGDTVFSVFVDYQTDAIGTITVSSAGAFTFATTDVGPLTIPDGTVLSVIAPGSLNGLAGFAATIKGALA